MGSVTITEFILARVAEDEQNIADARIGDGLEWWMPEQWTRERSLAECEVKRKIVELHEPGGGAWCTSACESESPMGCDTLRALAAIWADHDDYEEGWR